MKNLKNICCFNLKWSHTILSTLKGCHEGSMCRSPRIIPFCWLQTLFLLHFRSAHPHTVCLCLCLCLSHSLPPPLCFLSLRTQRLTPSILRLFLQALMSRHGLTGVPANEVDPHIVRLSYPPCKGTLGHTQILTITLQLVEL